MVTGLVVLFIIGYPLFFQADGAAAFKRRYYPWYLFLVSLLLMALLVGTQPWPVIFAAPLFALLMSRQIRTTRFCNDRGRPSVQLQDRYCASCGATLP